jgi:hypothetical protein
VETQLLIETTKPLSLSTAFFALLLFFLFLPPFLPSPRWGKKEIPAGIREQFWCQALESPSDIATTRF